MNRRLGGLIILSVVFSSCLDTIDVQLPANVAGRIVVEGSVQRSSQDYAIRAAVRRTVQLTDDAFDLEPAEIMLLANDRVVAPLANDQVWKVAISEFHSQFGGNPNTTIFSLRVITSDGRTLESSNQQIIDPPQNASLEVNLIVRPELNLSENIVDLDFIELLINTPLVNAEGKRVSFLWDVSGVFRFPEQVWTDNPFFLPDICYVYQPSLKNKVSVVSSADINGDHLSGFKIHETRADFKFHSGYYYTVLLKSVDVSTAEYWKEIEASLTREGTLFDAPPGKIRSNIVNVNDPDDESIVGYFYSAGIDTVRFLATPNQTGFQRHLCNPLDSMEVPCCNCLEGFRNSTLERPHYWK